MDDAANNNIDPLALSNGADLVNRELASAGYHKRLVFDLQKGTVEAQSVIQCVFALLQHFKVRPLSLQILNIPLNSPSSFLYYFLARVCVSRRVGAAGGQPRTRS